MPEAVSEDTRINQTAIRVVKDDITELDVDAFVFYAEPELKLGSGFGTAVSVRGGPSIQKALDELAPAATGDAVITEAGKLTADFIIHAVGPRFQEEDISGKLRTTMLNCLKRAEEKGAKRLAFPAMGAGYYGIPRELSAKVMFEAFKEHLGRETGLQEVTIAVLDTPQYEAFNAELAKLG
jgi:O-acetyl-ADP-ribose deacetylase (regulator of RNase III)